MAQFINDIEIEQKLKSIENEIKYKNDLTRDHVQRALNKLRGKGMWASEKREALKTMVERTGVKKIGMRTLYTPRQNLKEVDKTYDFLDDLFSYRGVIEEEEYLKRNR